MPLFNPASPVAIVVKAAGKVESLVDGLTGLGFDTSIPLIIVLRTTEETRIADGNQAHRQCL